MCLNCFLKSSNRRLEDAIFNRVNDPIKRILIEMDINQIIDMEDELVKYCVSAFFWMVSSYGFRQLVSSWNMHPISA